MDLPFGKAARAAAEMDRRGLTLAKVTNVTDPEKFNRVKCPSVGSENTEETDWRSVDGGGGRRLEYGFFWFPRVDDPFAWIIWTGIHTGRL